MGLFCKSIYRDISYTVCFNCRAFLYPNKMRQMRLMENDCAQSKIGVIQKMGLSEMQSKYLLIRNRDLEHVHMKRLYKITNIIQTLGFTGKDVLKSPTILSVHPSIIQNRFNIMEEGGFSVKTITLKMIRRFRTVIARKQVYILKANGYIETNFQVMRNILSYCDLPIELYPAEEDSLTLFEAHTKAIDTYICWLLDISLEEIKEKYKMYSRPTFQSMKLLMESLGILMNDIGFTKGKIGRNIFLLHSYPDNIHNLLKTVPSVGGYSIEYIVKIHPKILLRPAEEVLEMIEIFKENNIPLKAVAASSMILTLSPKTIRERMHLLQSNPNFRPFLHSPRACRLLLYYDKVRERNKLLKEAKWNCPNIQMLASDQTTFEKRLRTGLDKHYGSEVAYYFHKELGLKFEEVNEKLNLNPYWRQVPLTSMASTLEGLREAGFHDAHISQALTVTLYPKDAVLKCVKQLEWMKEVDCCRDTQTKKLNPVMCLQLALYYLELPTHFTGQGALSHTHGQQEHLEDADS